jgi:hypothetical protein
VRRNSLALVTAGFLLSAFHWLILVGFTNTRRWPAARRVFVGWRFAVHAVVILATLTALVWVLFQKDWDLDALKTIAGVLAVWGPSWMIHLALLHLYGKEKGPPRATPAAEVVDAISAD